MNPNNASPGRSRRSRRWALLAAVGAGVLMSTLVTAPANADWLPTQPMQIKSLSPAHLDQCVSIDLTKRERPLKLEPCGVTSVPAIQRWSAVGGTTGDRKLKNAQTGTCIHRTNFGAPMLLAQDSCDLVVLTHRFNPLPQSIAASNSGSLEFCWVAGDGQGKGDVVSNTVPCRFAATNPNLKWLPLPVRG